MFVQHSLFKHFLRNEFKFEEVSSPKIQTFLKKNLHLQDGRIREKVFEQAAAIQKNVFSQSSIDIGKIERALSETIVYHGKGIHVDRSGPDPQIHQIIQYLFGQSKPTAEWINERNIKAILLKEDPEILRAVREEFRMILEACGERLPLPGSKEEILYETFIGNLISLLPFSYPEKGEVFAIPQKIEGKWKNVVYTIDEKLELSPKWFSSPISAYGLTSLEGPPILAFLGTTYPAGEGSIATLLSDFTPFLSVGQAPYLYGEEEIKKWLADKEGVHLYGISLGGAFTFHVLRNHKEKIAQVDAYNPPGLYPWVWREKFDSTPIHIVYNENDLVATLGTFPEGDQVRVLRAFANESQNFLKAHMQVYTGFDETTLLKSDASYENGRIGRKIFTVLHFVLGAALVFFPILFLYFLYSFFKELIVNLIPKKFVSNNCFVYLISN